MPQDKQDTPAMKAIKAVGPSIRGIRNKVSPMQTEKKKKPKDSRSVFSPSRIAEDVGRGVSGLKYLPDWLLDNPRPKR